MGNPKLLTKTCEYKRLGKGVFIGDQRHVQKVKYCKTWQMTAKFVLFWTALQFLVSLLACFRQIIKRRVRD